jgi:hypothetical protein
MARRASTDWDPRPHKPIFYGPVARWSDRWAGSADGKAGIPAVPAELPAATDKSLGVTPYLEIRKRHFLDRSERERRYAIKDLRESYQRLKALSQEIVGAEDRLCDLRKRLENMPEQAPSEVLTTRNAVERNASDELIRTRRRREHTAERNKIINVEQQEARALHALRVEEARLAELISVRHRLLASRVTQLHQHTLRRCGTYRRWLQRKHPAGPTVMPLLDLALPTLPNWLPDPAQASSVSA